MCLRQVATVMDPVRQKAEQEKLMEARLRDKATLQRKQVRLSARMPLRKGSWGSQPPKLLM